MEQDADYKDRLYSVPGHPLQTLAKENRAIETFLKDTLMPHLDDLEGDNSPRMRQRLLEDIDYLAQIERHYKRINNLIMPYVVTVAGIAPQRVMLGIQDDVLRMIRDLHDDLLTPDSEPNGLRAFAAFLIRDIEIIIRQEREAYAQEASRLISDAQWQDIAKAEKVYAYCMIEDPEVWPADGKDEAPDGKPKSR